MFKDRKDAALQLARALEKYKGKQTVVLGIPRGGAETAYYVAHYLKATLSMLVSRKLGHPSNPEYAVGAMAEDGSIYLSKASRNEVSEEALEQTIAKQKKEIERRIQRLRHGEPLPPLKGKTVILVDDGIATGATLYAAISMCRNLEVGKLVIAAPVSGREKESELKDLVDDVVILETPESYFAVSQAYESFYDLTDEEALGFMDRWKKENESNST
ncbi:MAG: phosphoribosyltransferase [Pontibacter sp.]|nr:phosphoribosyltransferase [Pontibacter sp.]